jgi:hypothetical protein
LSDVASYVNNRRQDSRSEYDANGNTTSDLSYQQTIDASGTVIHSVSKAMVGDGDQYPLQPRLDITQTYDGTGAPAKRVQISRSPGIDDEFGNPGPPYEDTQTTYYIKSSVLGGATVAEIGRGDTIHIYAAGQRIAREFEGSVTFEHHNPATGSWVTSHGHSTYRTTAREERDPASAEIPLSDPYSYAQSYVDLKFSEPLFIEGGDPFDYVHGYSRDGLPMSRSQLNHILGKVASPRLLFDVYRTKSLTELPFRYYRTIILDLQSRKAATRPTKSQSSRLVPLQSTNELRDEFKELLQNPKCKSFVDSLITKAESHVDESLRLGLGFEDLFENIGGQGGYVLVDGLNLDGYPVSGLTDRNTTSILVGNAQAMIRTRSYFTSDPLRVRAKSFAAQRRNYLASAFHETFHHIGKTYSAYSDESLGRAAFAITGDNQLLPNDHDPLKWSSYWDNQLMKHCMPDMVRAGNVPNL